jgi:hypothetical protein
MDVIFTHCAGLDVHKKNITACRMIPDPTGQEAEGLLELQTFGTFTLELLAGRGRGDPRGHGEHGRILETGV